MKPTDLGRHRRFGWLSLLTSPDPLKVYLAIASIVFAHFTLAYPWSFPLTIGFIGLVIILVFSFSLGNWSQILLPQLYLASFSLLQVALLQQVGLDGLEYLKTYLLIAFNLAAWTMFSRSVPKWSPESVQLALRISLYIVAFFAISQWVTYSFLGTDVLFAPFGSYSYFNTAHPPVTQGLVRAYAGYLEPSFCGLILFGLFSGRLLGGKLLLSDCAVFMTAILCVGSLAGLLGALAITLLFIFLRIGVSGLRLVGASTLVLFILYVLVSFAGDSLIGKFVQSRFSDLYTEGTSTNFRLVAPLEVLSDVLLEFPFGRGFGAVEEVVLRYNLTNGIYAGQSIDNAVYLVVFYFGWPGILLWLILVFLALRAVVTNRLDSAIFWIFILLSANFTGGSVFNAEYALLSGLVILAFRFSPLKPPGKNSRVSPRFSRK